LNELLHGYSAIAEWKRALNLGATNERCDIELEVIDNEIEYLVLTSRNIP